MLAAFCIPKLAGSNLNNMQSERYDTTTCDVFEKLKLLTEKWDERNNFSRITPIIVNMIYVS